LGVEVGVRVGVGGWGVGIRNHKPKVCQRHTVRLVVPLSNSLKQNFLFEIFSRDLTNFEGKFVIGWRKWGLLGGISLTGERRWGMAGRI